MGGRRPKKKGRRREEPARRPAALPEEVPSTFPTLAAVLDRAVEQEESGQEIVDALVGALASLASPPSPWGPFVRETAQKLYANDREGARLSLDRLARRVSEHELAEEDLIARITEGPVPGGGYSGLGT